MSTSVPARAGVSSAGPRPMVGIVDDDPIMGESLVQRLQLEGYRTTWWQSGEEALSHLPGADCRVLVCDIRLPDLDGEQLFRRALPQLGATPVIFITAFGEVEHAVRLMQAGADDYVTKPFEIEVLLHKIAALCARELAAGSNNPGRETLSASAAMRSVECELLRVKDHASPVLLLGETGVGKEVAARQLHNASVRRDLPFVVVSCATIPVDRAENEMFGHERGGKHRPARRRWSSCIRNGSVSLPLRRGNGCWCGSSRSDRAAMKAARCGASAKRPAASSAYSSTGAPRAGSSRPIAVRRPNGSFRRAEKPMRRQRRSSWPNRWPSITISV
jgi:DNA-binding response OmpR family regulator